MNFWISDALEIVQTFLLLAKSKFLGLNFCEKGILDGIKYLH